MKRRVLTALGVVLVLAGTAALVWANGGLVSYWPFDEGTGTTAYDALNANHGTIYGATYTTDKAPIVGNEYALAFNRAELDYVQMPDFGTLEPANVTVAAWVKSPNPGSYGYVIAKGANACSAASYAIYPGGSAGLFFYIKPNGGSYILSPNGGSSVWDDTWHHVAGTYDGSTVRLYVDGAEIGAGTSTTAGIDYVESTNGFLLVGAYRGTCNYHFDGLIDEAGVWGRALSADEIAALSAGIGSLEWLPPITLPDWTLNENATLPIKFKLYDPYGNLICADLGPTLEVRGQSSELTFDSTKCYYIANFRPTESGPHTAVVSINSVELGSHGFEVVEPGKANGRGHGNQ